MASRDVAMAWPMAHPSSQQVLVQPEVVGVSAVSVDATLRRIYRILSSVSDSVMVVTEGFQPDDWTRSGSGLPLSEGSVVDECGDIAGGVAAVVMSLVVLVGDIAVGMMLPTVAGAASPADFAEVVAADAISLANAEMVTVGVTDLADAGIPFPADPAGVVTGGVADLADAGIPFPADSVGTVTISVTDLADAGIPFPADPAETVTVGVADLADAGIPFPADPTGLSP